MSYSCSFETPFMRYFVSVLKRREEKKFSLIYVLLCAHFYVLQKERIFLATDEVEEEAFAMLFPIILHYKKYSFDI